MARPDAPWHAHVYYAAADRAAAERLHARFVTLRDGDRSTVRFVGRLVDRPIGPHPIPQFEVHFPEQAAPAIRAEIAASGLRALMHPLTDDDLADHTTLAQWIGDPLALDLSVLDPPGHNQGVARFGNSDF